MLTPFFAMRQRQAKPDDGWRQTGPNTWFRKNNLSPDQIQHYKLAAGALQQARENASNDAAERQSAAQVRNAVARQRGRS